MILDFDKIRFLKFVLVGILNTGVGYTIYATFIYIGMSYSIASLFSLVLGVLFNYLTTSRWVFNNPTENFLMKYVLSYFSLYLMTLTMLFLLIELFGFSEYSAGFILLPVNAFISYFILSMFVFVKNGKNILSAK